MEIADVVDIHHIHLWSMDGQINYATMHIVTNADNHEIKQKIREVLHENGISHVTLELESEGEHCHEKYCKVKVCSNKGHHHHH